MPCVFDDFSCLQGIDGQRRACLGNRKSSSNICNVPIEDLSLEVLCRDIRWVIVGADLLDLQFFV